MPEGHDWPRDHILAFVSRDPSVTPRWEPTEKGWQLIVWSSPGFILTAFKKIICLGIFFLISLCSS